MMVTKYSAEDVRKQIFVIGNSTNGIMGRPQTNKLECKINEYHKLIENIKLETIILQEQVVTTGIVIEILPQFWSNYK